MTSTDSKYSFKRIYYGMLKSFSEIDQEKVLAQTIYSFHTLCGMHCCKVQS